MYKVLVLLAIIASCVYGQSLVNIIQFSDPYCLCANEQHISVVDLCLPVLGGYQVYRVVDGTPDKVIIQSCSDNACTTCQNVTTYNALPPCQAESDGLSYYSVLPEDDPTTYYNAPSVVTTRFAYKNCSGDAVHVDIAYGISCFPTATGGSFYYACPDGETSSYYVYNCSDNACLEECEESVFPTETCTDDEGVYKSVACTPSSSSTTQTSTSNDNTVTSGNSLANGASATVSTTTSASSHNVSSSASAANTATAGTATSGGVADIYSDRRGGHMKRKQQHARNNPPFCNGGLPPSTSSSISSISTGANDATSATAATAGTATSGGSGGSSGGRGNKIFIK